MDALMNFFMRVPKWTLPIIMVAPTIVLLCYLKATEIAGPEYQQVSIGSQEVALIIDPEVDGCVERGGQLMLGNDGCMLPRILGPGVHTVRADYRIEKWDMFPPMPIRGEIQ